MIVVVVVSLCSGAKAWLRDAVLNNTGAMSLSSMVAEYSNALDLGTCTVNDIVSRTLLGFIQDVTYVDILCSLLSVVVCYWYVVCCCLHFY